MSDPNLGEILRRLQYLEQDRREYVSRDLFTATLRTIEAAQDNTEADVAEIKEGQKWAIRLIVTILITNFVGLVYFLVQSGGP